MCNLINTHTHTHTLPPREDQCEWHRMTRMTGPDCVVMCNLINTHTHLINTHTHTHTHTEDQCESHRMTRMTGPDCAVMCNLINTHTHIQIAWTREVLARGAVRFDVHTRAQTLFGLDLRLVVHPMPYGLWGILRVTVYFGKIVEEDLLRNRWAQQP